MQNEREAVERLRRALRTRPITLIIPQVYNEDRAGNNPWGAFADDLQTILAMISAAPALEGEGDSSGAESAASPVAGDRTAGETPCQSEWRPIPDDAETVRYVARYGGMCRDCADEAGVCPQSGLPCDGVDRAIRHVIKALNYGFSHGYLPPPPPPSPDAEPSAAVWRVCEVIKGDCQHCSASEDRPPHGRMVRGCYHHATECINVVETGNPWRKTGDVRAPWISASPPPSDGVTLPKPPRLGGRCDG